MAQGRDAGAAEARVLQLASAPAGTVPAADIATFATAFADQSALSALAVVFTVCNAGDCLANKLACADAGVVPAVIALLRGRESRILKSALRALGALAHCCSANADEIALDVDALRLICALMASRVQNVRTEAGLVLSWVIGSVSSQGARAVTRCGELTRLLEETAVLDADGDTCAGSNLACLGLATIDR